MSETKPKRRLFLNGPVGINKDGSSFYSRLSDGVNRNDDEIVGNENVVSPLQQLLYHINTDPRWEQVFRQFWNAIEKEHPPGSG